MRLALFASLAAGLVVACSSSDDTTPAPAATPTYAKDVYPILQQNCALTGCHGANTEASDPKSGPPRGVYISPSDKDVTYKKLINTDSTYFKGTKLILPGDPDNSLVMRKIDGTQAQLASCPGECGTSMPPPEDSADTSGSQLLSEKKRSKIRAWIAAGAAND
ncbi:MAG: hypothetical protein U0270_18655 [Labilithrix sp.]